MTPCNGRTRWQEAASDFTAWNNMFPLLHTDKKINNRKLDDRICISHESVTKYFTTSCEIKGKTMGKLVDLLKRRIVLAEHHSFPLQQHREKKAH